MSEATKQVPVMSTEDLRASWKADLKSGKITIDQYLEREDKLRLAENPPKRTGQWAVSKDKGVICFYPHGLQRPVSAYEQYFDQLVESIANGEYAAFKALPENASRLAEVKAAWLAAKAAKAAGKAK